MTRSEAAPRSGRRLTIGRLALAILLLGLIGGGVWYATHRSAGSNPGSSGEPGSSRKTGGFGGGPGGMDRPQPVSALEVQQRDVRILVNAIGTATPRSLVTVRSRVDGELLKLHFKEGQMVREGQLLAEIDPRSFKAQVAQVKGQLMRDQAQLENARLDLKRYQDLLSQDSIAKQQVDTQAALVRQLEGTVQTDQGQLDNAQLQLQYTRITAPISGRIGLRQVDPGNQVKASDANGLTSIAQLDPMTVLFTVSEAQLPNVVSRFQDGKPMDVEAWDREFRNPLAQGKLVTIDNQIDPATGTLKLRAEFPNKNTALFPNQFVNIRLVLGVQPQALVVNNGAILRGSKGNFVYKVQANNTVSMVPVKLGYVEGDYTAVEGELKPGDQVVSDGTDKLKDGAKVEVIKPGAATPSAGNKQKRGKGHKPEQ
ncbi:MdtA/MuxA family multidrug efflux RND transporter periplasmic adaptor subunit [Limnobacter humi]|uniref:MdtA/MuxA family multidrug efflux RND transporter periplasmic adaptor subunit n=1 Tax=Limnobacter humi TaxID=1778671 RepID=A0ABT1WL87_9BURK|nr:MdtA/MuxA family multidrug efflux RND transporter periplasmic adaptor subunit [Limnobacter humi]MCQ8897594.1 MdtA/MuxA family multidrug efflux RND transporter periplasmic adaptor subunit [Limnobacter humi]